MNPAEWHAWQKAHYAQGGGRNDTKNSLGTGRFEFARASLPPPPCLVADMGCNDGAFAREMAAKGHAVVGFDFEEQFRDRTFEAHEQYVRSLMTEGLPPPEPGHVLYVGGNFDYKTAEAAWHPFDAILLLEILEHVVYDYSLLLWAYHALRPGGKVIITVPISDSNCLPGDHHLRYFTERSLTKMLWAVGFQGIGTEKTADGTSLGAVAVRP